MTNYIDNLYCDCFIKHMVIFMRFSMTQMNVNSPEFIKSALNFVGYYGIAKLMLGNRYILANILKECAPEFQEYDIDFIVNNCLQGRLNISSAFYRLDKYDCSNEDIVGLDTADVSLSEETAGFNLFAEVLVPNPKDEDHGLKESQDLPDAAASKDAKADAVSADPEKVILLIDVEPGRHPDMDDRDMIWMSTYYPVRMLDMLHSAMFAKNYDISRIRKIYAIGICLDLANDSTDSVFGFNVIPHRGFMEDAGEKDGEDAAPKKITKEDLEDLLHVIFIDIADLPEDSDYRIITMLRNLYLHRKPLAELKGILEHEFGIRMTAAEEERFTAMRNMISEMRGWRENYELADGSDINRPETIRVLPRQRAS